MIIAPTKAKATVNLFVIQIHGLNDLEIEADCDGFEDVEGAGEHALMKARRVGLMLAMRLADPDGDGCLGAPALVDDARSTLDYCGVHPLGCVVHVIAIVLAGKRCGTRGWSVKEYPVMNYAASEQLVAMVEGWR